MHKPFSNLSRPGRHGFLGLAVVAALHDSVLRRKRVVRGSFAKDALAENTDSSAGSSQGLPPLKITDVRVIVTCAEEDEGSSNGRKARGFPQGRAAEPR